MQGQRNEAKSSGSRTPLLISRIFVIFDKNVLLSSRKKKEAQFSLALHDHDLSRCPIYNSAVQLEKKEVTLNLSSNFFT